MFLIFFFAKVEKITILFEFLFILAICSIFGKTDEKYWKKERCLVYLCC